MADEKDNLPEGTDQVIAGASKTVADDTGTQRTTTAETPLVASGGSDSGLADRLRTGRDKLSGQAADKARGLVHQGLERGSEALANVSKLVGDTAAGLDERLGSEYGDYARRAAGAIENAASSIAAKDADELIDDTREFVRKSPGVALAGAAVVGFALARLIKSGLTRGDEDDDDRGPRDRKA